MTDEVAHLKELVFQRFADQEKALALQAEEYERRLEDLNHAHAQAAEKERDYLTRDKYDEARKADALARELAVGGVDARLKVLENWRSRASGAAVILMVFAGLVGAAVVKALGG